MRLDGFAAAALAIALCGCAETAAREPPPGAIRLGEDDYMVPAGDDGSGCPRYAPRSGGRAVAAAVFYRKADGGFTLYRSDTGCGDRAPGSRRDAGSSGDDRAVARGPAAPSEALPAPVSGPVSVRDRQGENGG